jgi:aspartate 1-decarboxylase
MQLHMLKAKLHEACVTQSELRYEGSLGIDVELMELVGLHAYEKVLVSNINNGARFETYAIAEPFGSRRIVLNGAAARLGVPGDRIIIMSFCAVDEAIVTSGNHRPKVVRLDERNEPIASGPQTVPTDKVAVTH